MISSNAMAVILDEFPHMAGTASSLAGRSASELVPWWGVTLNGDL